MHKPFWEIQFARLTLVYGFSSINMFVSAFHVHFLFAYSLHWRNKSDQHNIMTWLWLTQRWLINVTVMKYSALLLWSRRLLFRSRAQAFLRHILQLQPVHTASWKCDRPSHSAVRSVHVPAGQSGKWAVKRSFYCFYGKCCDLLYVLLLHHKHVSVWSMSSRYPNKEHIRQHLMYRFWVWAPFSFLSICGLWTSLREGTIAIWDTSASAKQPSRFIILRRERDGKRGSMPGQDKMGNVSCLTTSQLRLSQSLPLQMRRCGQGLAAGCAGACWLQTGGLDRLFSLLNLTRSRADVIN